MQKRISPTQLVKGSKGFNEFRWPSRLGLAEDGMSKAKRPVAREPTSYTAPRYSTSGSPGPRVALGIRSASIQPWKGEEQKSDLVIENKKVSNCYELPKIRYSAKRENRVSIEKFSKNLRFSLSRVK